VTYEKHVGTELIFTDWRTMDMEHGYCLLLCETCRKVLGQSPGVSLPGNHSLFLTFE